jgi:hypothetical protein
MHWIFTQLLHKELGQTVSLFNIYVPQHIEEKIICWQSIQDYLIDNELENIILGGDLNVTLAIEEKRGGVHCKGPNQRVGGGPDLSMRLNGHQTLKRALHLDQQKGRPRTHSSPLG